MYPNEKKGKLTEYNTEYRESVIKLAVENNKPVTQTAKEFGVNYIPG